jgi:hypothetical protein
MNRKAVAANVSNRTWLYGCIVGGDAKRAQTYYLLRGYVVLVFKGHDFRESYQLGFSYPFFTILFYEDLDGPAVSVALCDRGS